MNTATAINLQSRQPKRTRSAGTRCIWPNGAEQRYGISAVTRWRWEKDGKLPARDVYIGGRAVGWRPETLEAAERGNSA
jgi:predicted DNA-binding transcriptional regulator AlpA